MTMKPETGDGQWVKVEFYGRMPPSLVVKDVNLAEVSQNLARTFGFSYTDGLTVSAAQR